MGGANLTVGGATEQLLWRFVIGASVGAASFSLINALGGSPIAQGIIFFLVVFALTLFRSKVFKADIGITFATLASVYAVDNAYRGGNVYGVDKLALKDLLKSWAFGAAISLVSLQLPRSYRSSALSANGFQTRPITNTGAYTQAVNFLVLPVKASRLSRDRTSKTLSRIQSITTWLLSSSSSTNDHSDDVSYTPASVRRILHGEGDTLVALQAELGWELGWSASDLSQRGQITDAVLQLQRSLVSAARDGPFVVDLPEDLRGMVEPAVSTFADCKSTLVGSLGYQTGNRT